VEWSKTEKRTFLRHRVELRLASLYLETRDYSAALPLISECAPVGTRSRERSPLKHTLALSRRALTARRAQPVD